MSENWCAQAPFSNIYRSLPALLPAISDALGCACRTKLYGNPEKCRLELGLPECKACLLVLVDGLGFFNLERNLGYAPFLRSLKNSSSPIFSCFPTTTSVAVSSFGTGTCPGMTSIFGYTQINPFTGQMAQMISFKNSPEPGVVQKEPSVFSMLKKKGCAAAAVGMKKFNASPLTQAALSGAEYVEEESLLAAAEMSGSLTRSFRLVYFYIPSVDKAGHKFGCGSAEWKAALEEADMQIKRAFMSSRKGTLMVVCADHGMVDRGRGFGLDSLPKSLMDGVKLACGEQRDAMLYLCDGKNASDVASKWEGYFEGAANCLTKDEALRLGMFGMASRESLPYLGDVFVAFKKNFVLDVFGTRGVPMLGVHGSWTETEAKVPLIAVLR